VPQVRHSTPQKIAAGKLKKPADMIDGLSQEIAAPDLIATQTEIAAVAPFPA